MKNRIKITLISIALLTFAAVSYAQPRGAGNGPAGNRGPAGDREPIIERVLDDLTEDQKEALETLRVEHQKEMTTLRNQMGELRAKQRTLMSENPLNAKAAKANSSDIAKQMNKQMDARIEHKAELQKILTEEQMLKLDQAQKRRKFANRKNTPRRGVGQNGRPGRSSRPGYSQGGGQSGGQR